MPVSQSLQTAQTQAPPSLYEQRLQKLAGYLDSIRGDRTVTPEMAESTRNAWETVSALTAVEYGAGAPGEALRAPCTEGSEGSPACCHDAGPRVPRP